jgi:hypothetical protein
MLSEEESVPVRRTRLNTDIFTEENFFKVNVEGIEDVVTTALLHCEVSSRKWMKKKSRRRRKIMGDVRETPFSGKKDHHSFTKFPAFTPLSF